MWDDAAITLAAVWAGSVLAVIFIVAREIRSYNRVRGQGAPRWAPDPAFDPALREDHEVAELEMLWEMGEGVPGAW